MAQAAGKIGAIPRSAAFGLAALLVLAACQERELILEGERFDPRAPLEASLVEEGAPPPVDTTNQIVNRSEPISLPPQTQVADWTQRGGNARHLPPHAALSAQPALVWSVNIGQGNSRRTRIAAQPVIGGGLVFAMDSVARVTAVSPAGGTAWTADLTPEIARNEISGGGLAFGNGRLFATTGYGELIAMDPQTGAVIWRQKLGAPAAGAPTVDGNLVFAVARDSSAWAVAAENGRVVWQLPGTPSPSGMIGAASPAVTGTTVLLPFASGEVTAALREGGVRLWSATVAGSRRGRTYARLSEITGDPVVAGDVTYVGNQSGRTVAIDTGTGIRRWTAKEGAYGPVLPIGGAVFLVSDEARLVRLDAGTGETVWSVEMPYFTATRERRRAEIVPHFGPVLAGGRLVVASGDGLVRFFNPVDGSPLGAVNVPGGAAAAPAFAQGLMVIAGQNGQLHAFR
ncbi:MAG: PQQ-binding-like beta-propeller repeat protein [Paracoccaceae bacterium]|nr:MAG: PQQ-binding-like beta-propeller repeat protein [Paracoccaceae bacterium]